MSSTSPDAENATAARRCFGEKRQEALQDLLERVTFRESREHGALEHTRAEEHGLSTRDLQVPLRPRSARMNFETSWQ
jgi:hypothetical protein